MAMVLGGSKCGKGQDGAVGDDDMLQSLQIVLEGLNIEA